MNLSIIANPYYYLHFVKHEILVYIPLALIIFGSIGFICNTFTFLQPKLRYNSCCIYLLCGSFSDVINLFVNLLSNYLYVKTDYILSLITVRYVCKLKLFSQVFLPQLSNDFIMLSLIDCFARTCCIKSSMQIIRQPKMIPWLIFVTIVISAVISFYSPVYHDVVPNLGCICINRFLDGFLYITIQGFMTPLVMLMFVVYTYRNHKRTRPRVVSVVLLSFNNLKNVFRLF